MEEPELTDKEFAKFRDLIYQLTGIVINEGKRQLVLSRLTKRLRMHGLSSFSEYYELVTNAGDDEEQSAFINSITTNKTDFFREPHHFEYIARELVPALAQSARRGERKPMLRVWHAGCSTGEEPYTLGVTLSEAFANHSEWDWRQLASDIDTNVLAHAERGIYDESRTDTIPRDLLRKYFLRGSGEREGSYKVKRELQEHLTFRQVNLLEPSWPMRPDTKFDIIFCRNVVIYFDKPTQKRLFERFASRLQPGGLLFIGHSESLLGISNAFDACGQTIYRLTGNERLVEKAA
ncbi:chemotaxis protein methyltransferase [Capsulimonas corticalis]|uniref:protein-glutamate O-methyltransferase n=1 Tax=Capsulimonas corticalis TaxID=2219043 RepID=A0A402D6L4_9BACT|nr:protein-glutamate O-methyltransferase CheR [Capsulimonas corticalis]BDI30595.1 chemotaxis protein methyltransferase [Capsulimonas corticalis]